LSVDVFAEFPQRPAHECLGGSDWDAETFSNFVVGQGAILPQEKHFSLCGTQTKQGGAQARELLLLDESFNGTCLKGRLDDFSTLERSVEATSQVFSGVDRDSPNPGPQVQDVGKRVAGLPTAKEAELQSILGILQVAEQ
jgi:hypothetical protein